jgi:hypothetical protein
LVRGEFLANKAAQRLYHYSNVLCSITYHSPTLQRRCEGAKQEIQRTMAKQETFYVEPELMGEKK